MKLFKRHILTIITLLLYWPGLFIFTHIPVPVMPSFFEFRVSDKMLHYLAYFVLVFLLWFAINPNNKVNWRKAAVWWILLLVIWYGVADEWLQGYVERDPDIKDFFADLAGAATGLVMLTIFSFWSAALIVAGCAIFIFTNFVEANPLDIFIITGSLFYLFAYGFFTILWLRWMHHFLPVRIPEPKWLIGALSLPLGLMLMVNLFCLFAGGKITILNAAVSVGGIAATVIPTYLTALFRYRLSGRISSIDA